jgi:hypothetical protein
MMIIFYEAREDVISSFDIPCLCVACFNLDTAVCSFPIYDLIMYVHMQRKDFWWRETFTANTLVPSLHTLVSFN